MRLCDLSRAACRLLGADLGFTVGSRGLGDGSRAAGGGGELGAAVGGAGVVHSVQIETVLLAVKVWVSAPLFPVTEHGGLPGFHALGGHGIQADEEPARRSGSWHLFVLQSLQNGVDLVLAVGLDVCEFLLQVNGGGIEVGDEGGLAEGVDEDLHRPFLFLNVEFAFPEVVLGGKVHRCHVGNALHDAGDAGEVGGDLWGRVIRREIEEFRT